MTNQLENSVRDIAATATRALAVLAMSELDAVLTHIQEMHFSQDLELNERRRVRETYDYICARRHALALAGDQAC